MKKKIKKILLLCTLLSFQAIIAKSQNANDIYIYNNYITFKSSGFTETSIKEYLKSNIKTIDLVEGIWSMNMTISINNKKASTQGSCKYALIRDKYDYSKFNMIIVDAATTTFSDMGCKEYDIIGVLSKTSYPNVFVQNDVDSKTEIRNSPKTYNVYLQENGLLSYSYDFYATTDFYFKVDAKDMKIYPTYSDYNEAKTVVIPNVETKKTPSTGTGFAIASNGFIVTCNHVIEGSSNIKVKGINGDFNKEYVASVIATDKNNDLAILKIKDASFSSFGTIPYTIKTSSSDVGSNIYIMGFPLTATMGDEVKLTNGIISAKSGYTGDITSYQISAAAQPGNSGGPLFDKNGYLIGVVNAKHVQAESATYAVKSSYLINLIESLTTKPLLPTLNSLMTKPLTEQVKLIKNFVFIIEVN